MFRKSLALVQVAKRSSYSVLYSTSSQQVQSEQIRFSKQHEWNKAVAEAERLVGFPTSLNSLQLVMNDDSISMTAYIKKLMASDHPVLKTVKRMVYNDKNEMQVRGLMILLLSRSLMEKTKGMSDFDEESGVLEKHRKLAESIEMIYSSQSLLKSVLNLPPDLHELPDSSTKRDLLELEYGNKIAILAGDYLLAQACVALADLRDTHVVEMVTMAIADFTQAEFVGRRDIQGRMIPTEQHITTESWEYRNGLAYGRTMAAGCKSAAMFGKAESETRDAFGDIGSNLALALQANSELGSYSEGAACNGEAFDLGSAPVILHLKNDTEMLKYVQACKDNNLDELDFKQIFQAVRSGSGVAQAHEMCASLVQRSKQSIEKVDDGDAKEALLKLVKYLKN